MALPVFVVVDLLVRCRSVINFQKHVLYYHMNNSVIFLVILVSCSNNFVNILYRSKLKTDIDLVWIISITDYYWHKLFKKFIASISFSNATFVKGTDHWKSVPYTICIIHIWICLIFKDSTRENGCARSAIWVWILWRAEPVVVDSPAAFQPLRPVQPQQPASPHQPISALTQVQRVQNQLIDELFPTRWWP